MNLARGRPVGLGWGELARQVEPDLAGKPISRADLAPRGQPRRVGPCFLTRTLSTSLHGPENSRLFVSGSGSVELLTRLLVAVELCSLQLAVQSRGLRKSLSDTSTLRVDYYSMKKAAALPLGRSIDARSVSQTVYASCALWLRACGFSSAAPCKSLPVMKLAGHCRSPTDYLLTWLYKT